MRLQLISAGICVSPEQLEAAVLAELDLLHRDGVTDAEISRARALIETSFVTSLQSAAERADQLSRFATYFGDASIANEQVARYQATSAADVSALARERLGPNNRALLWFLPLEEHSDRVVRSDDTAAMVSA